MGRDWALVAIGAAVVVAGCVSPEIARFTAQPGQQAIVRDGQPAIVSRKQSSIVMVRPAKRQFQAGVRPVYVVALFNLRSEPVNFSVRNILVDQMNAGQPTRGLRVYSYDDLLIEERNRQIFAGVLTVLSAAANSYSASRAGYYNASGTVHGPGGVSTIHVSGYSPTANAIAQNRAAAQNDAMIANVVETGQQNLAVLEQTVIKDNTLMAGEWYGGQLHFDPPQDDGGKNFRITIQIGFDRHEIDVAHERAN